MDACAECGNKNLGYGALCVECREELGWSAPEDRELPLTFLP